MFRNPFTPQSWYKIQKKWWSIVAPTLMADLKRLEEMSSRQWVEYEKMSDRIEELEDRNAELERKNAIPDQSGYWFINSEETSTSCYRLDQKFIDWYQLWREGIQMELEFEYERKWTEQEQQKLDQLHWDDEAYR